MFPSFVSILLTACTPSESFSADRGVTPVVLPDVATPTHVSPTFSPAPADVTGVDATAALTLPVTVDPELDGFVELRAWHTDEDGAAWMGEALVSRPVTGGEMKLALPATAPALDLQQSGGAQVTYAVALRAVDNVGEPGVYLGLADADLVYRSGAAGENARKGWMVVVDDFERGPVVHDLTEELALTENVAGPGRLALAGDTAMELPPGARLAGVTEADGVTAFDGILEPSWVLGLEMAPAPQAIGTYDGLDGAVLHLLAYADADADPTRVDEPVLGRVCADADAAVLTWFPYAHDLLAARALRDRAVRGGWDLLDASPIDGGAPLPSTLHTALTVAEACE